MDKIKQYRLSSNWTMFLKLFFPTFWGVFFGMLLLAIFVSNTEDSAFLSSTLVKFSILGFVLLFAAIFYLTILKLKRVDADANHIYVSNYFKTYRYKLVDMAKVKEIDFGLFLVLKVELKQVGAFGKSFVFILSKATFDDFLDKHPECHIYFDTTKT
jgi:hypothetical protein